jgi:hypothetical protein
MSSLLSTRKRKLSAGGSYAAQSSQIRHLLTADTAVVKLMAPARLRMEETVHCNHAGVVDLKEQGLWKSGGTWDSPYVNLFRFSVLLLSNWFMPSHPTVSDRCVQHVATLIPAMPMCRTRGTPNYIPDIYFLRLSSLIADPPRSSRNNQQLSTFMCMPMCPGARREHYIQDCEAFLSNDRIRPNVASKSWAEFDTTLIPTRISNNCHNHFDVRALLMGSRLD